MGGAVKKIANVATLGLAGGILGDALDTPKSDTTTATDIKNNEVSAESTAGLDADKRRRARAAGLSSTILGGGVAGAQTTAGKSLLGS